MSGEAAVEELKSQLSEMKEKEEPEVPEKKSEQKESDVLAEIKSLKESITKLSEQPQLKAIAESEPQQLNKEISMLRAIR